MDVQGGLLPQALREMERRGTHPLLAQVPPPRTCRGPGVGRGPPRSCGPAGRQGWAQWAQRMTPSSWPPARPRRSRESDVAQAPTWGSSARTRSLRTGARRFISPATSRGDQGRRGGLTRPGDPWRPDDHSRPSCTDYHSGPRATCGSPRPRGRYDHRGPRGRDDHPGPGCTHYHPGPGRPKDDPGAGRPLGRRMGARSPVPRRWGPGPGRPYNNSGPESADNDSGPRGSDDSAGWGRRPDHNRAGRAAECAEPCSRARGAAAAVRGSASLLSA